MKTKNLNHIYSLTLKYIGRSARCEKDVRKYLKRKNLKDNDIDTIISKLVNYNFVNDEEYAQFFTEKLTRNSDLSSFAVRYKLSKKGIQKTIIDKIVKKRFEGVDENETV